MRCPRRVLAALVTTLVCPVAGRAQICDQANRLGRPIPLGVSGGSAASIRRMRTGNLIRVSCSGGTLGALVQDSRGHRFVLSNNHVIGRSNAARPGESIIQPGFQSVQCNKQLTGPVARFSRRIRLVFGETGSNDADAAIARVRPGAVSERIDNIGPISDEPSEPIVGLAVQKMGATSCLTQGIVSAVAIDVRVMGYNQPGRPPRVAMFRNQILVTAPSGGPISAEGDSGSLIVTTDACPRPVGLLFAGGTLGTLASPLAPIMSTLGVSFVNGCSASAGAIANAAPGDARRASIASATATRDAHRTRLARIPGTIGTGIGVDGAKDMVTIDVFVRSLTAEARAAAPAEVGGVPVRLREAGDFVSQ
jgi:hypothetical protein